MKCRSGNDDDQLKVFERWRGVSWLLQKEPVAMALC